MDGLFPPDPLQPARRWANTIFGRGSAEHEWVMAAAADLLAGREPSPFPSGRASTKAVRLDTLRRLLGL